MRSLLMRIVAVYSRARAATAAAAQHNAPPHPRCAAHCCCCCCCYCCSVVYGPTDRRNGMPFSLPHHLTNYAIANDDPRLSTPRHTPRIRLLKSGMSCHSFPHQLPPSPSPSIPAPSLHISSVSIFFSAQCRGLHASD